MYPQAAFVFACLMWRDPSSKEVFVDEAVVWCLIRFIHPRLHHSLDKLLYRARKRLIAAVNRRRRQHKAQHRAACMVEGVSL